MKLNIKTSVTTQHIVTRKWQKLYTLMYQVQFHFFTTVKRDAWAPQWNPAIHDSMKINPLEPQVTSLCGCVWKCTTVRGEGMADNLPENISFSFESIDQKQWSNANVWNTRREEGHLERLYNREENRVNLRSYREKLGKLCSGFNGIVKSITFRWH